jgi:hypothetical protein
VDYKEMRGLFIAQRMQTKEEEDETTKNKVVDGGGAVFNLQPFS